MNHNISDVRERFVTDGIVFPIRIAAPESMQALVEDYQVLENRMREWSSTRQLMKANIVSNWVNDLVRNDRLLDAVEALLGPDILCWSATFFAKPANTHGYVGWHQDIRYWGLEPHEHVVTAWIALTDAKKDNGCMRAVAASHRGVLHEHISVVGTENLLNSQQEVDESAIDSRAIVDVELEPGQASLHHSQLLHGSHANHSTRPRIGLSVNYISSDVRQITNDGIDSAMLVRGTDAYRHFNLEPRPQSDFDANALRAWIAAMTMPSGIGSTSREGMQRLHYENIR